MFGILICRVGQHCVNLAPYNGSNDLSLKQTAKGMIFTLYRKPLETSGIRYNKSQNLATGPENMANKKRTPQ